MIREEKQTTKLQIIYNASAKSTGPSLNDCLYANRSVEFDENFLSLNPAPASRCFDLIYVAQMLHQYYLSECEVIYVNRIQESSHK